MSRSLKKNYILNLINTISGMLFPLITFPYASRILEADGIGVVNFYQSIISYISLITCLGIPLYATREVAKVKYDSDKLSRVTLEILWLHFLLTFLGIIVVVILSFTVPKIKDDAILFLTLSSSIIFTAMGCEWFYRGTEDFKYITIRGIIVRIIYIPLLFIFVKTKSDLLAYGVLTVFVSVGNNTFNFYRLTKKIQFKDLKIVVKKPRKHLKGALRIFALTASISIYTQLNIVLLGFMSSATNVGYYVGASKIVSVMNGLITALQTTLLPRVSSLIALSDEEGFKKTIRTVFNFIFFIALPLFMGLIVLARPIIIAFCGGSYLPAISTLKIISPSLFIIALSAVISGGVLLPKGKENLATIACLAGGFINILLNTVLIPRLAQNGTAIASVSTELTVTTVMFILGWNYIPTGIFKLSYVKYIGASVIMFITCTYIITFIQNITMQLVSIPIIGALIYISCLLLMRDNFLINLLYSLKFKIHR